MTLSDLSVPISCFMPGNDYPRWNYGNILMVAGSWMASNRKPIGTPYICEVFATVGDDKRKAQVYAVGHDSALRAIDALVGRSRHSQLRPGSWI